MTRARLVPEVVQTSAMDCGPACLTALLAGHGIAASYAALRDACQTEVDGTSIDTIEDAALQLGLDAEQTIIPLDHVLADGAAALPALAVARQPDGNTHFIVLWSRFARRVQVMDPAIGRRWAAPARLLDELYVHEMELPAELWRELAGEDTFHAPLARRLRALGDRAPFERVARALRDDTWRSIATLDAAVRAVQALVDAGATRRGDAALALVDALARDDRAIPEAAWTARPTGDPANVRVRGAVLLRVRGATPAEPASEELRAALAERPPRPWRHVLAALGAAPLALFAVAALGAAMYVAQAALWRALFDTSELTTPQVGGALVALIAFLALDLAVEASFVHGEHRLGRRLELGLRARLADKLARVGLRYLRSRPISDLAERAHRLNRLRELPGVAARIARVALTAIFAALALGWLAPEARWLVAALALAVVAPPLLGHAPLVERELRVRTQSGALARFYLDALLGLVPARAHGAERALRREHEARFVDWTRAARREQALATAVSGVQASLIAALVIALVATHAASTARPASVLLLVYWTIGMAGHGAQLAALVRELPAHRNLTLRLLEPLAAQVDEPASRAPAAAAAVSVELAGARVVAGGHVVLDGISLAIGAGEHVAIVGRSGAGKSTLFGLLLGWHRPAAGEVRIDGAPLDAPALRARTAWVDPAVQLWNDSLAANLAFGIAGAPDLGGAAVRAQLDDVLARLPEGMQTRLGEAGGLVSGGEGQRVRFGRALLREPVALALLDEPFRGLDRARRRELLDVARARWRGTTLLCATHDLAETRAFDRVIVIDGGRIVEDGTPGELAQREGSRYAALLAEELAATAHWERWRHLRVAGGRVEESA